MDSAFVFWLSTILGDSELQNIITDVISNQNRHIRIGSLTVSHQNVLIQKSHSMCECAVTSVTNHPRHRPHHHYIITLSVCVLDNANAIILTAAHLRQAAVTINHYIKINTVPLRQLHNRY